MAAKAPQPDLSEFESFSRNAPARCVVARRLERLAPAERKKLQAALDAEHISHRAIQSWLRKRHGVRMDDQTIKKHRVGECCCG